MIKTIAHSLITSYSCALIRRIYCTCVTYSPKLQRTSKDVQKRGAWDSCNNEIQTLSNGRRRFKISKSRTQITLKKHWKKKASTQMAHLNLTNSSVMKNLKTLRVKKKTWKSTWIKWTSELIFSLTHGRNRKTCSQKWVITKSSWNKPKREKTWKPSKIRWRSWVGMIMLKAIRTQQMKNWKSSHWKSSLLLNS